MPTAAGRSPPLPAPAAGVNPCSAAPIDMPLRQLFGLHEQLEAESALRGGGVPASGYRADVARARARARRIDELYLAGGGGQPTGIPRESRTP